MFTKRMSKYCIIYKISPLLITDKESKYYLDISHLKLIINKTVQLNKEKNYSLILKDYSIKLFKNKSTLNYELKLLINV